uniref:MIF4G domain-containing protein n=1 Tax=Parastrongyloides trichosuri TaxID=131310 RepID=A0A0N4ZE95_PARTI
MRGKNFDDNASRLISIGFQLPLKFSDDPNDNNEEDGNMDETNEDKMKKEEIFEQFNEIFSTRTFSKVLLELRTAVNITSESLRDRIQIILSNVTNKDYVKLITNEKILSLCPYFVSILKMRMDPPLRYMILCIVRHTLACYEPNEGNPYGTIELEEELTRLSDTSTIETAIGVWPNDNCIKWDLTIRILAYSIIKDECKNPLQIYGDSCNEPIINFVSMLDKYMGRWIDLICLDYNKNDEEISEYKMLMGDCAHNIYKLKDFSNILQKIPGSVGDMRHMDVIGIFRKVIGHIYLTFKSRSIFHKKCGELFNLNIRDIFIMFTEIIMNIFLIVDTLNLLVGLFYIVFNLINVKEYYNRLILRIIFIIEFYGKQADIYFSDDERDDTLDLKGRISNILDFFKALHSNISHGDSLNKTDMF